MRRHPIKSRKSSDHRPLIGKTRRFPIPPNRRHQDRRRREDRRPPLTWEDS